MIDRIRIRVPSGLTWRTTLVMAALTFELCGLPIQAADEPARDREDEVRREESLKKLKRSAEQYAVFPGDDRARAFKFREDAVMRFSNPITGCKDAAIFLWVDGGRPQAIVKVFTYDNNLVSNEWQSLSEGAIFGERDGKTVWKPTDRGVTFGELTGAPRPADSAAERLRQMKALAGKFSATYADAAPGSKPVDLRLLIQPVFRFETGENQRGPDGAVFAFALGTNPMRILLLEARQIGDSRKWHYAFARTATGAVPARYDDREVFSVERYDFRRDPKQTFLALPNQPVPKE